MKNIVLIGMMASGKSTCGGILSEKLNCPLVDTDVIIVGRTGKSIPELFAEIGEEGFRTLESEVAEQLSREEGLIIATGGGLPLREENAALLRKNGVVFWLCRDPEETFKSESMVGRPLAQMGKEDFVARFQRREPLYRAAAHFVVRDFSSPENTVAEILRCLELKE